jgi:ribonuclease P protein component
LLPEERLRKRADFLRCYQRGRRHHGRLITLYVVHRGPSAQHARLGITVTRKVGGAVVRQRVKRRLREIYRRWEHRRELPAIDLVVHAKPKVREADFATLRSEMSDLLEPLRQSGHRPG